MCANGSDPAPSEAQSTFVGVEKQAFEHGRYDYDLRALAQCQ